MGRYINPGFDGFRIISRKDYVDKTGIIELLNDKIGTTQRLMCVSRPRRFGKSFSAQTLCAYYDCSVDSHELFDGLEIAKSSSYEEYINNYNVVYLDISEFISAVDRENRDYSDLTEDISTALLNDLYDLYKDMPQGRSLTEALELYSKYTEKMYVFILDEWDSIIRETDSVTQNKYLSMLRELFKSSRFTPKYIAAAYMTGILPIKRTKSQSAVSDFMEYTILEPEEFAPYTGFTEDEVKKLCTEKNISFEMAKKWYDGYIVGDIKSVYNPYSMSRALMKKAFRSYWKRSSSTKDLQFFVEMNYDGLQDEVIKLIKGEEIIVDVEGFQNDLQSFMNKDDVLTLLIHLGYLTYDSETKLAHIPNEEIHSEFRSMLKDTKHPKLIELVSRSKKLLEDTLAENETAVGEAIDRLCETNYAPMFYNNEQALRSTIKLAYLTAVDRYIKIEELPSGKGLADIVYLPQRGSPNPAMIIELKWNRTEESAINQIKKRNYPAVLQNFGGDILLVGINYDDKEKKHQCRIERVTV